MSLVNDSNGSTQALPEHVRVAVIGSGFSGIATAIRLRQEGIEDFVVLERDSEVGGTWWANTYPGCACDVPSHLYSFSFAPNPEWSRTFSPQSEILEYARRCVDRFGIRSRIRLGCGVEILAWDDRSRHWTLETSQGTMTADIVISGVGMLTEPLLPSIPGIDDFEGTIFHSASWNHEHDLTGERVAVIGTGASTIQIVPEIQPKVGRLKVFQRTAPWVLPHRDRPINEWERRLYRAVPAAQRLMRNAIYWARELFVIPLTHPRMLRGVERQARRHLANQVHDPELRAKLTPDYTIGCKRILQSNDYYPALETPNTELVTDGITEIRQSSIVTAGGSEHEVDTIVLGTGFHVTDFPFAECVVGRDGRKLSEHWIDGLEAYRSTTVKGFPNLFIVPGPNTGLGHTSVLVMIEAQIGYVIDALRKMDRYGLETVEVRPEVQAAYNKEIQRRLEGTVWNSGGCVSWYLDKNGKNTTLWPRTTWRFTRQMRDFDLASYSVNSTVRSSSNGHGAASVVASKVASS